MKESYRTKNVLLTASKIFERHLVKQVEKVMESCLFMLLCGFCKKAQHPTIFSSLLEKSTLCLDAGGEIGAVMMDHLKAFDFFTK